MFKYLHGPFAILYGFLMGCGVTLLNLIATSS